MPIQNASILVVDDEPANVMLLTRIFGRDNTVYTASNGHDALNIIAQQELDVVLLDIMMPHINGLQVLEQIRQTTTRSQLPVILISALNDVSDVIHGIQIGANDYISKPFDYEVLQVRVCTQIELRRALRQREQLAEELQIANEVKKRMMQIASHDLKSPIQNLTFIHGMLKDQFGDDDNARELLALAKQGTDTMLALIYDFLEMDMLRGDDVPVRLAPVDVFELLYELYSEYELPAHQKSITIHADIPEGIIVTADRQRLRQAITNLLSNAIKYNPQGASIHINCLTDDHNVHIHIIDQGEGIPPAEVENLFTAFSEISTQPTAGEHSTGLGLWSVKQIMQALGGDVAYQPAPGGGADFWLTIPRATIEIA